LSVQYITSMKFSTSSTDLLKQLQLAQGAIGSNPVLPILEDFCFSIGGDQLTISATDLETTITTTMTVQADGDGSIAIPGKILLDTLKALPEQPITFSIDMNTFGVEIISGYGKYKLAGENGQDFPSIPAEDSAQTIEIPAQTLAKAINKTVFATSTDELRPAMTGVFFQLHTDGLVFVATDAHKLVKYTYTAATATENTSFIVPKKALNLLKGTLPAGGHINMAFNKAHAFFSFGEVRVVCRLIDARYPDYNAVIPTENPNVMTISRDDFQRSLKRIAIYANKTTNQVVLDIAPDSLTISAQDLDFSNEAFEQLRCNYEGNPIKVGYNAKFLVEMLNVMDADEVSLEMSTPTRAGLLLPVEKTDNEDLLMLVMPVMLAN
jgi:DNA polymerase-3 subunit beta